MLITEVILENFMSYEYARVPFKPGVNVVCGPNGAGKSSILLGISVALGQSYTERSRKLSDLIRWERDQARVTLVLDNSYRGKRRPVPRFNKDQIFLTRVLRRDGKYWFELDNRAATKQEVQRLLSSLGVDPDNMLIIMHQNMVERFAVLSPQEKLRMVEAAVGFESYRRNVLEARRKLGRVLSQEESVAKLLESAEQTLSHWREQYDRYQEKKQLLMKRRFLERELAWAQVAKREKAVSSLKEQVQREREEVERIEAEIKTVEDQLGHLQSQLEQTREAWRKLLEERLRLERERARCESGVGFSDRALKETQAWLESHRKSMKEYLDRIGKIETGLQATPNPTQPINLEVQLTEAKRLWQRWEETWIQNLGLRTAELKQQMDSFNQQLTRLNSEVSNTEKGMNQMSLRMERTTDNLLEHKVRLALLQFRGESLRKSLRRLEQELRSAQTEYNTELDKARETGPQIAPMKSIEEILDEMRLADGHIAALADVSEDIERMYESYSKLYLELKEKAQTVANNRQKALTEVKTRMEAWHKVLQNLLNQINVPYQKILGNAQAWGEVRLSNEHDIEAAGLQIFVGFKGAEPVPLDAYTQSGGERSTATMSFLLALQQHVRSPFRAVDEFDIHMDPKNREIIAELLLSSVNGTTAQYVAITPGQITITSNNVHIITVQNMEGTSIIKEMARN